MAIRQEAFVIEVLFGESETHAGLCGSPIFNKLIIVCFLFSYDWWTLFTFAFSLLLMLIDLITIIQSGTIGLTGVISAKHEGKLSKRRALLYGISQFIFCLDVVAAVVLYFKLKAIYFETS